MFVVYDIIFLICLDYVVFVVLKLIKENDYFNILWQLIYIYNGKNFVIINVENDIFDKIKLIIML